MENVTKHIYVCNDSIEGIFTAVYDAWASGYGHANNYLQLEGEQELRLFSEYIEVKPELLKTNKVTNTIKTKIGNEAYRLIYYMAISNQKEKADHIYRFIILGLHYGPKVLDYLSNDTVSIMFKTYKRVGMEGHHYNGFVRFSETSSHILVSRIRPDNNILPIIATHFADRFKIENFMIIDEARKIAVVHPAHKQWFIISTELMDQEMLQESSEKEEQMQGAWKAFIQNISIKERENLKLQQNMCPLRYREFMPEFSKK
ncbi:MAG: TIGR03915 family putative DNA repair protein [bacterium]|nr:TIGR03915 family putative DNA repair protein [bacterium]